jgi:hypothetical protein
VPESRTITWLPLLVMSYAVTSLSLFSSAARPCDVRAIPKEAPRRAKCGAVEKVGSIELGNRSRTECVRLGLSGRPAGGAVARSSGIAQLSRRGSTLPFRTSATKASHSAGPNTRVGPVRSFESRTATRSWAIATSMQLPVLLSVLFRHTARDRSTIP